MTYRPCRVAISNPRRGWGGAATMALGLATGLVARGHPVVLLCRPKSALFEAATRAAGDVDREARTSGRLIVEPVLLGGDFPFVSWARCRRALRRNEVQVVLSATVKDVRMTVPAAKLAGVPVVARRVTSAPFGRGLVALFDRLPDAYVANSAATRVAMLRSAPWLDEQRVTVIHNGVDVRRFDEARPADLGLPDGAIAVGYVGRLVEEKGISDLAAAWPRVADAVPNAHLFVAGPGDGTRLFEPLASRRAHVLGFRDDVPELMRALDLVVVPSHTEAFGLAAAEALAAGRPVVASAVGGLAEVVRDGVHGLLTRPKEPEALADAVIRLCRDEVGRRRMGRDGRAHVLAHYSWTRTLDAYEALLERIVQTKRKRSD